MYQSEYEGQQRRGKPSQFNFVNDFLDRTHSNLVDERHYCEPADTVQHYSMSSNRPETMVTGYKDSVRVVVEMEEDSIRDVLRRFEERERFRHSFHEAGAELFQIKQDLNELLEICSKNPALQKHLEEFRFLAKLEGYNGRSLK